MTLKQTNWLIFRIPDAFRYNRGSNRPGRLSRSMSIGSLNIPRNFTSSGSGNEQSHVTGQTDHVFTGRRQRSGSVGDMSAMWSSWKVLEMAYQFLVIPERGILKCRQMKVQNFWKISEILFTASVRLSTNLVADTHTYSKNSYVSFKFVLFNHDEQSLATHGQSVS